MTTNADELYQAVTDICFNNGGATKPMVDKLTHLIRQEVLKELDALEKQKRTADSFVGDVYVIRATRVHQRQEKLSQELNGEHNGQ